MDIQSSVLCSFFETDSDREARLDISRLRSHPIPIWWYRRCINDRDNRNDARREDLSPFPKSWSVNFGSQSADEFRKEVGVDVMDEQNNENNSQIRTTETDESSVYSTVSQEKRNKLERMRDKEGNCIRHSSVKLAQKRHPEDVKKPRLSKILGKQRSSKKFLRKQRSGLFGKQQSGKLFPKEKPIDENPATPEWAILLEECPECKLESESKRQIQTQSTYRSTEASVTYEPFPATITIVESHPHLKTGSLALQIRTDPVPIDQIRRLSCNVDDGALDFMIACDSDGNIIPNNTEDYTKTTSGENKHQYEIMERIIPLSSIDHISRGGDVWDVLRPSFDEDDLGCRCDLKIHGFSDRLLRFDVIGFGISSQRNTITRTHEMRYSFAMVDFLRSSMSLFSHKDQRGTDGEIEHQWDLGDYTIENVMSKFNTLVKWDRQRREMGVEGWTHCFSTCLEEYLSLGVPSPGKEFKPVRKKKFL